MDRSGFNPRDYDSRRAELRGSYGRDSQASNLQDSLRRQQAQLQSQSQHRSHYDELSRNYQDSYSTDAYRQQAASDYYESRQENRYQPQDSRHQLPDSRYQLPDSRYQQQDSRYQLQDSRYQLSDSSHGDLDSRYQTSDSRYQSSDAHHRTADSRGPNRYDAVQQDPRARPSDRPQTSKSRLKSDKEKLLEERKAAMMDSYSSMMRTYTRQQAKLGSRPSWKVVNTRDAEEPDELTITHVNQTSHLNNPALLDAKFAESMSTEEWLLAHGLESAKLTIKDLVDKGAIGKPDVNPNNHKVRQHIQFEANDINEFEYKINMAIEKYTVRIKWLLQGSRRFFGLVKGHRVGVMIDASDAHYGFGRLSGFQEALTHLLDEQLSKKKGIFLQCFGTQPLQLWNDTMDINCRSIEEAKQWIDSLAPSGGSNVLKALKVMLQRKDIDSVLLILGSTPDQPGDIIADYVDELCAGRPLPIQTVAYDCTNPAAVNCLKQIASNTGGRFHSYGSSNEMFGSSIVPYGAKSSHPQQEMLYQGTDVALILTEIQKAQETINKIKEMRQGMLGTALISVMNEIGKEVAKLPQSRFLPRPPGHEDPLRIEMGSFQPSASSDWLAKHGLKAKNLDLYQVLAPNAYSFKEEFIPVIRKTVHSQVHGSAMAQFQWHDGTVKNVHVDMTQLFEYQKQLGATVALYEKRIDWLGSGTRKTFGTVTENRVVILVDLSISNLKYLVHIQHSLRLLLEQQMANKDYFNIIGFGSEATKFRPTMVKPTPENLQSAWKFVLDMQCAGSRNFMDAYRLAVENDQESDHQIDVEGIYLFISGIPDQQSDICNNYVEESATGRNIKVHAALFNVDDYDSHGAIPSRYANITKTAECLRNMAHCSGGRFHWFRETGIIESDDIATVSLEIEKALNFSKKCSMLVNSVKKKYGLDVSEMKALPSSSSPLALAYTEPLKALPPPKHTVLTQTRVEKASVTEASKTLFRPSSATSRDGEGRGTNPMARVKGRKVQKAFFYTDDKQGPVGSVFSKYPSHKPKVNPIKAHSIPDKEEQLTAREWLRKYSLQRLKLNLNKIVTGPETKQTVKPVKILKKAVESKVYRTFPTISVNGQLQYLQLQPRELKDYENQVEHVLHRYLKRLQWLVSSSRRIFGTVVEKKCVFLIDTSGSMDTKMDELKRELASLIWDQLHKNRIKFNLIAFSRDCESFEDELVEPTEENCHRAVQWTSGLAANGNTCTLEALELAFSHLELEAIYLFTDGKPDTSTSLVLKEVVNLNQDRDVVVNTISFNCDDITANNFLKTLATQTSGRYHRCHADFDAQKFAHKLITDGFSDPEYPPLPEFDGDDLKKLGSEIAAARKFLAQSQQYRQIHSEHQRKLAAEQTDDEDNSKLKLWSGPSLGRPKSAKI